MSYRDVVLADNPAAYWRLGESSGSTAYDETSNGYDATYRGDPTLGVSGCLRNSQDTAVDFDGSGDYVDAGDIIDPMSSSCSFELWVNMDQLETERGLMLKDDGSDGWGVQLGDGTADGNVRFFQRGASTVILATTTDPVATGQWHHIVAVYDSSTGDRQIYVDATLEASDTIATGGFASASAKLAIAATRDGSDAVDGQVDEVAVYTAALSASRIQQHYDEARKVALDAHVSVLEHKLLFPGTFEAHTVESVHFPLGIKIGLPAHTSILAHQDQSDSNTGTDNSKEGQAKALKAALGYGWGVPDPKGSANEKIETPRESWPIERTSEAKRLMHDQGMDAETAEGVGEAMRKLGEDISHDVRTNLQRYEWHANTHTHSRLGGVSGTPIGPAEAVFVAGDALERLRADNGQLVWSVGADYRHLDVDFENERVLAVSNSGTEVNHIAAYTFDGELIWKVDPFRDLSDVEDKYLKGSLSRDRQKVYTLYENNDGETVFIELDAKDGARNILPAKEPLTFGLLNGAILDVTQDWVYYLDDYQGGRLRKHSRGDGSLDWEADLGNSGSSTTTLIVTDTLVWALSGVKMHIVRPQSGAVLDTHDLPGRSGDDNWMWMDYQNSDSVYCVTTTPSFGSDESYLHRLWVEAETIQADEKIWEEQQSNLRFRLVVRDADGNFYIANSWEDNEIIKLDAGLSEQWRVQRYAPAIQTDQGRSVRW
jgi:hypothetical protein